MKKLPMSAPFAEAVRELSTLAGVDFRSALKDEHVRWSLYEASMRDPVRHEVLRAAVRGDPSVPLASAVVTRALESVRSAERLIWVDTLQPGQLRDHAATRAAELGVLDALTSGGDVIEVRSADVEGWTQWLQQRVAERTDKTKVLGALVRAGATKHIRRVAGERLHKLSQNDA